MEAGREDGGKERRKEARMKEEREGWGGRERPS